MGLVKSVSKRIRKIRNSIQAHRDSRQGEILGQDFEQFKRAYKELTDHRFAQQTRPAKPCDDVSETLIQEAVDSLRRDGIAICRGWLDDDSVQQARREMSELEADWHEIFKGQSERARVKDLEKDAVYIFGNYAQDQRLRVSFHRGNSLDKPGTVSNLLSDWKLAEIASRYFDGSTECAYVLAERLDPAPLGDRWHVDRITDQVKAMVLLTDVDIEQGPLRYKKQTHRNPVSMNEVYHKVFRNGVDEAYPQESLVQSLPGEVVFGTGRAGDCIIFDTLGVHSGTKCIEKFRQALVATFAGPTRKTERLLRLSKQEFI